MDEVRLQTRESRKSQDLQGSRVVVYVDVQPRQTVNWRLPRDVELRVADAAVWLTRHRDHYDYWLKPGDVVRLSRGERVWLSSESAHAIEVSLTSYGTRARGFMFWPRVPNLT